MSENRFQCPHEADADFICNVLIAELSASKTLYNKLMISQAIMDLRQFVKPMVVEWEYINGDASRLTDGVTDKPK